MDSTSSDSLPSVEEQEMYFQFALENEKFENLIAYLQTGNFAVGLPRNQRRVIRKQASLYTWDSMKQILYYVGSRDGRKKEVIRNPDELTRVLHLYHGSGNGGHSGWRRTYEKISQHYFWHGIKEDVKHYVAACDRCQRFALLKTLAPEMKPIKVKSPLELVGMDLIGSQATPADVAGVSAEQHGDTTQQQEKCWSHEAILLLIETYRLHQRGFSDSSKRKYQVWQDISKELQAKGHVVDGTACEQKMRALKRRYNIIKDNASLSGRGALSQWPYFSAMDDLLAGDPATVPEAVETCFPVASTSGTQAQSAPAGVSEPVACSTPSPAPSPTISSMPIHSQSPSSDSMIRPQPKRRRTVEESPYAETFIQLLEMLISSQNERTIAMTEFMNQLSSRGSTPSERSVEAEKEELRRKNEELQQHLLQQKEEHLREIMAVYEQHKADMKDLQEQHKNEIKEIQQQHQHEIKEIQQQQQQQVMELILQRR